MTIFSKLIMMKLFFYCTVPPPLSADYAVLELVEAVLEFPLAV